MMRITTGGAGRFFSTDFGDQRRLPVRIGLAGSWMRGQTVVDRRDTSLDHADDPYGLAPALLDVALGVDADRYARLRLDAVS